MRTVTVLYEHPQWFEPLFAELERRGLPYERLHAERLVFAPSHDPRLCLLFNRMSPSAHLRGAANAIFATRHFLARLREHRVPTVNGYEAFSFETSKVAQLALLDRLGLRYPRTRVVNRPELAPEAARELRFPVLLKPNVGGSGAGIRRFQTRERLEEAARAGELDLGLDQTGLVQEELVPAGGHIVRVEVLDGRFLYAIRVYPRAESFNLCPADICHDPAPGTGACPGEVPRLGLRVEACDPPSHVVGEVLAIARAGGLDLGGIEYLVNEADGEVYYYDINALSNFVSDAPRILGFDPFEALGDYLELRLGALAA